jgi:nitric oxide reductase subunit B
LLWQWLRFVGDVPFAIAALTMAFDSIVKLGPLFPAWTERLTLRHRATSAE